MNQKSPRFLEDGSFHAKDVKRKKGQKKDEQYRKNSGKPINNVFCFHVFYFNNIIAASYFGLIISLELSK